MRSVNDVSNRAASPRKTVDWDAAEAFFLALDPPRRLQRVVEEFAVSRVSVGKQAKRRQWREKATEIDRRAAAKAFEVGARNREHRVAQAKRIIDGYLDRYETELDRHELKPGDLPAIVKLAELLEGEATDRVAVGEVQALVLTVVRVAGEFVPRDLRPAFLERMDSATSGLLELGPGEQAA